MLLFKARIYLRIEKIVFSQYFKLLEGIGRIFKQNFLSENVSFEMSFFKNCIQFQVRFFQGPEFAS